MQGETAGFPASSGQPEHLGRDGRDHASSGAEKVMIHPEPLGRVEAGVICGPGPASLVDSCLGTWQSLTAALSPSWVLPGNLGMRVEQ